MGLRVSRSLLTILLVLFSARVSSLYVSENTVCRKPCFREGYLSAARE